MPADLEAMFKGGDGSPSIPHSPVDSADSKISRRETHRLMHRLRYPRTLLRRGDCVSKVSQLRETAAEPGAGVDGGELRHPEPIPSPISAEVLDVLAEERACSAVRTLRIRQ